MNMPNHDEMIHRAARSSKDAEEEQKKRLFELAGPQAAEMLRNKRAAARLLQSDVPNLRRAAIHVLAWHWRVRPGTDNAVKIGEIARHDTDDEVRREAIMWVGLIYGGTDDVEIGELLARTVLDETEKIGTRENAYDGLYLLRWHPPKTSSLTRFPEVVDWAFVRAFLDTSRKPQPVDFRHAIYQLSACAHSAEELEIGDTARLIKAGLYEETIASATTLLESDLKPGEKAFVHRLRAEALIAHGVPKDAIRDLSEAIDLDPNRAKAFRLRSNAYKLLGDEGKAQDDARRAKEIGGD